MIVFFAIKTYLFAMLRLFVQLYLFMLKREGERYSAGFC